MPEYLSPGVYIEELSGPKSIQGVGTSTGAFVGIAERGPINSPQLVTNMTQFADTFGNFTPKAFLAYGVQHFFIEGGTRCYVVRAFKPSGPPTVADPTPDTARADLRTAAAPGGDLVMSVLASSEGAWGNRVSVLASEPGFSPDADPANDPRFKLSVYLDDSPLPVEVFDQLSMNEFDGPTDFPNPDHVEVRINGVSKYITVIDATDDRANITPPFFPPPPATPADPLPTTHLAGGSDGADFGTADANFKPADLIGKFATATTPATGLNAFDTVDDINIVVIPDLVNPGFAAAGARDATLLAFTYCENRKDCFFVADTPRGLTPQGALAYKRGVAPQPTGSAFNSKYGALYYPWIQAVDPVTGKRKLLPPSGAVAGSYSAADVRVGVHKAPAGTEDGFLNAAADVERVITKGEQDTLNPEGVNVIRKFSATGVNIWGARTVSNDPEWRYISVRRLFIMIEQSILRGTQGLVFEPNDRSLWKRVIRDVGAFLTNVWRTGALVGDKPEKAFFVKCDEETNPPESVDAGLLVTLIGVAPVKPAEFVIFRIRQTRSGGSAEE